MLTDFGATEVMKAYFQANALTLHLFTTNVTITDTTQSTDLVEAVGGGYAEIPILTTDWSFAVTGGVSTATNILKTYTFAGALTGNTTIYGYYITNAEGSMIIAKNTPAFAPTSSGDMYAVLPKVRLSNGVVS